VLYTVTYEGVRVGSVESLPRGSRRALWIAYSAITQERMRFPTRREASAWLVARYLQQRDRRT
jgi:hypothetical protein